MKSWLFIFLVLVCCSFTAASQTVDFNATEECHGELTLLLGSSTLQDTAIASWLWDLDEDGIFDDASGKNINHLFSQPDTIQVSLKIIPNSGQPDSVTNPVIVNPLPDVNFNVDNTCEFQAAVYNSQSTIQWGSIVEWQWDFDNNDTIDDNSGPVTYYTVGPAETYSSKLTCVSDMGCEAFAVKTTEVYHVPNASFYNYASCLGDSTAFFNTSTIDSNNIAFYVWNFGDGNSTSASGDVKHQYELEGSYTVQLVAVSEFDCRDTAETDITVYNPEELSFSYSNDTVIIEGQTTEVTAEGNFVDYTWNTTETSSSIVVTETGQYSVTATDPNGCKVSEATTIIVAEDVLQLASDIITPNSDGINDALTIKNLSALGSCSVVIYNRWNDKVYENSGYQNDWQATHNGKPLDPGTYFYVIKCTGKDDLVGSINVLR